MKTLTSLLTLGIVFFASVVWAQISEPEMSGSQKRQEDPPSEMSGSQKRESEIPPSGEMSGSLKREGAQDTEMPGSQKREGAQDSEKLGSQNRQDDPSQIGPALADYLAKRKRMGMIDQEINAIFANLSVGMPNKQKMQMAQVNALEDEKKQLVFDIFESSVEAFRETDSDPDRILVRDLFVFASASVYGNKYRLPLNPQKTIEICELLMSKEMDVRSVRELAASASCMIHDFDMAAQHIMKLQEDNASEQLELQFEALKKSSQAWQKELELRQNTSTLPLATVQTSEGTFKIELFEDQAPGTVANFVSLADQGFYAEKTIFDVRRGEFVRTGCPTNSGTGSAGYLVAGEATNENARKHFTLSVSMVPLGEQQNHSSQFIICQRPETRFDGSFTVFGRVIEGADVILRIQAPITGPLGEPDEVVTIESIKVSNRRPGTKYVPNKLALPVAPADSGESMQPENK